MAALPGACALPRIAAPIVRAAPNPMPLPYPLPALDTSAPFDRHAGAVLPGWVDGNGHMNVGYYGVAFDKAGDDFCDQLGVGWAYVEHRLGMVFAVEAHFTYERELREGERFRVSTQLLGFDAKRCHIFHAMRRNDGERAASNEILMLHVDFATRRASPWREETRARLEALWEAHRALPIPDAAGRRMGLEAKPPRR